MNEESKEEEAQKRLEEEAYKGRLAKLIDSGNVSADIVIRLKDIMRDMRQNALEQFAASDPTDIQLHALVKLYINLLDDFYGHLLVGVTNGQAAEISFKELTKKHKDLAEKLH